VTRSSLVVMTNIEVKSFDSAEINNVLPDGLGEAAVVEFGDVKVTRMRIKPGWRWSEHIKPMVGTESCQVRHLGVVTKGRVRVIHDDGTESTYGAGDAYSIMPGHDAWVEGDEAVEGFEFAGTWADKL
jgi:quercetin dioxygenase-like cupin family protein